MTENQKENQPSTSFVGNITYMTAVLKGHVDVAVRGKSMENAAQKTILFV